MSAPRDLAAEARSKADAMRTNGRPATALLLTELADRIAELEAEREPIGYDCRLQHSGMRELTRSTDRATAAAEAENWRRRGFVASVVELREVTG